MPEDPMKCEVLENWLSIKTCKRELYRSTISSWFPLKKIMQMSSIKCEWEGELSEIQAAARTRRTEEETIALIYFLFIFFGNNLSFVISKACRTIYSFNSLQKRLNILLAVGESLSIYEIKF